MTTPAPVVVVRPPKPAHIRCTWSGIFGQPGAPIEEWSFSLSLPPDATVSGFSDLQIDGLANGMRTCYVSALNPQMPSDVHLTESRFAAVGANGKVLLRADGSYIQGINVQPSLGVTAPAGIPLQTALCVSLVTARPGPTGKGRFFLPFPGVAIEVATKTLNLSGATVMLDRCRDFLVAVNLLTEGDVSVVSTKGYLSTVIGLRVGLVPDTMRSRRGRIPEGYVSRGLAAN